MSYERVRYYLVKNVCDTYLAYTLNASRLVEVHFCMYGVHVSMLVCRCVTTTCLPPPPPPAFQADFIRDYLGPVIRKDHPDVKIMAFDHNRDHRECLA